MDSLVQAYCMGKNYFELGVRGEGQDTNRHFEGGFGSKRAWLAMWGLKAKNRTQGNRA